MSALAAPPPRRRARAAAALVIAAVGALHLWLSAGAAPPGFYSDDALYLLMAEWFAGAEAPVLEQVARRSHLPPLYSLLLAAVGAEGDAPLTGHLANAVLFTGALALSLLLHRRRQPWWPALLAVALLAVTPAGVLHAFTLWSEPLYMLMSLAVLLLLAPERPTRSAWLAACAIVGLALLTRTVAVALLAAMLWAALRQRPARPWLLLVVLVAPLLAWTLLGPAREPEQGYLDLLLAMLVEGRPAGLAEVLLANLRALADGWRQCFDLLGGTATATAASVALLPALLGWLRRLRRGCVDAVYVLAYLGAVLPWPATPDHFPRFLLPLLPLALGYAGDVGVLLATRVAAARRARALLAASPLLLAAVAALPSQTLMASRLLSAPPPELAHFAHSTWWLREPGRETAVAVLDHNASAVGAARGLREHLAPGQCLYARPVQFYMLHARRPSYLPAARHAENSPSCRYVYAAAAVDGTIVMEGVVSGSRLVATPATLLPPPRPAGMLFELP